MFTIGRCKGLDEDFSQKFKSQHFQKEWLKFKIDLLKQRDSHQTDTLQMTSQYSVLHAIKYYANIFRIC